MERLVEQRPSGLGRSALRMWGMLFLVLGVISRSILQFRMLGMGTVSAQELLAAMDASESVMVYATSALVLQAMETCAIPIFAFLLAEGLKNTKDFRSYFLRVFGVAVLAELPYNFAMSGKLLDFSGRNPAFGLVMAMVAVYFFRRYSQKKLKDFLIRVVILVAAVMWCTILGIQYGGCTVAVVLTLWLMWDKPLYRNIAGASVMLICSVFSLFLMASPMSFLVLHLYNGVKKEESRMVNYLAYPVLLLIVGLAGAYLV